MTPAKRQHNSEYMYFKGITIWRSKHKIRTFRLSPSGCWRLRFSDSESMWKQ